MTTMRATRGRQALAGTVATLTLLAGLGSAPAEPADEAGLSLLLRRLWLASDWAPRRPVALTIRSGLAPNAVAGARTIAVSRDYLRWTDRFPPAERERILARTLAHELAHLVLGHRTAASPAQELAAEALGIHYFERAGFDCRWWVDYVGRAGETAGRPGWPARAELVAHAADACARARATEALAQ
jgi:hypothetical protein